jgi:hypothetical protein
MKKIILSIAIGLVFLGCEDFMDTKNFTKQDDNSFPLTVDEANQLIVGVYNTLNEEISDYGKAAFFFNELASDERFGGGGTDNFNWQAISKLLNFGPDLTLGYWQNRYQGIFRTNVALEKFENIAWANDKQKNTAYGEVHFFRGYYYFTLVQFFENVPLLTESLSGNAPQAPVDDVYAQAAFDLKKAIEMLPGDPYTSVEKGRVTKWAAQSIMARMFLFYTGFYNKSEMPVAGGGTITKAQVISWLEDCITNSGHDLVSDYRNLWPYTNQYTVEHYHYTKGQGLKWAGESNKEVVFATKCAGTSSSFRNGLCLAFTVRRPHGETLFPFPFTRGYGGGPISPVMVEQWKQLEPTDMRLLASIWSADEYPGQYQWGGDNQAEETGYWQKKYMGIASKTADGVYQHSYNVPMYGLSVSSATSTGAFTQDLVHIRFSDVLLMHSELTETSTGINRVRSRAGLEPVSYSLTALKQERRFELCFENSRYNDIRRWGDAEALLDAQLGIPVRTTNLPSQITHQIGFGARYRATRGFWPIPQSQILLSNNVLKQNAGWGTSDVEFTGL